jgi:hypothetical protein
MFLQSFHHESAEGVRITPEQASRFAKEIAGDFNPIHDPGAKRFCVPGDLLFSLVLARYGLSTGMCFTFSGMVGADALLQFPATEAAKFAVTDERERVCLSVEREGETRRDADLVVAMARLSAWADLQLVDGFSAGAGGTALQAARRLSFTTSGRSQAYALSLMLGVLLMAAWVLFR